MKRDMDLVRKILVEIEEASGEVNIASLDCCGAYPLKLIVYHVELLAHHGLVDARIDQGWHGVTGTRAILGLTWDGCDYLDAIRDDGIWKRTKGLIRDTVGSTTLDVIKQTAIKVTMQMIEAAL